MSHPSDQQTTEKPQPEAPDLPAEQEPSSDLSAQEAMRPKNEPGQHGDRLENTGEHAADRNAGARNPSSTAPGEESDGEQDSSTKQGIQYVGEVMGQDRSHQGSRNAAHDTGLSEDDIAWGTIQRGGNEERGAAQTVGEVLGHTTLDSNLPPDVLQETAPDQHETHEAPAQMTAEQVTEAGPHAIQRAGEQESGQPWLSRIRRWFTGKGE